MKKLLAGTILAVGLAWSPAWAATPKDTLVIAKNIDDMITLDPAETYELSGGEVVSNLYDRLVGFEQEDIKKLVPTLAESYTVSDDGKTITFKLRPGQKFQSGNPVTADDVVFSMQRVIALNLTPAFILSQFGWTPANVTQLVKAVDPMTVSVTVTEDLAPTFVLNCLSAGVASIVDKKLAMQHEKNGDFGHDWLKTHSAGSGPYSLRAWKANESVAMDAYAGARHTAVQMKRVIIRHVPEASAQRLLLEKGDVDIARNLTPDQLKGVANDKNITVEADPKSVVYYMGLSQKVEPLSKPKVREAIRWLIDYQGMADTFLKGSFKVHQAFWPSGFACSLTDTPFHLDVAKAKALLAEAGYPNGFEVQIDAGNSPPFSDMAQAIQSSLAQGGIKASIVSAETKQVITKYRARNAQIVLLYWDPDYLDPHSNADFFSSNPDNTDATKKKSLAWRNSWDIPELTKETTAALSERDGDKRCQTYIDLQKKLQDDGALIVMFQQTEALAARSNVKGFFSGPMTNLVFYRAVTK
jgi:peptide/nickel transport system substrate-binding protein